MRKPPAQNRLRSDCRQRQGNQASIPIRSTGQDRAPAPSVESAGQAGGNRPSRLERLRRRTAAAIDDAGPHRQMHQFHRLVDV